MVTKTALYEILKKAGDDFCAPISYDEYSNQFHVCTVHGGVWEYIKVVVPGWWGKMDHLHQIAFIDIANGETMPFDDVIPAYNELLNELGLKVENHRIVPLPQQTVYFSRYYQDWGITPAEFWGDPELREAVNRVMATFPNPYRTLEIRLTMELSRRAACGAQIGENGMLKIADSRNRAMMLNDYAFYKNQFELFGAGSLPAK